MKEQNRQQNCANCSPGDHLQISVTVKSNPDGLKTLDGQIDCARASQSNRNPGLHVLFYSGNTVLGQHKAPLTIFARQIFICSVLRGDSLVRYVQLPGPHCKRSPHF
jgi:hypothetical protein